MGKPLCGDGDTSPLPRSPMAGSQYHRTSGGLPPCGVPKGKCDVAAPRKTLRIKRHRLIVVAMVFAQGCDGHHSGENML